MAPETGGFPVPTTAIEAAMGVVLREVVRPNPATTWEDTIREAVDALLAEWGVQVETGQEVGMTFPYCRLVTPWSPVVEPKEKPDGR